MNIRLGTEEDKNAILEEYPYTAQVMHTGGDLIVAYENSKIAGFLWSFTRDILANVDKTESFINVIEVFNPQCRSKGIGSLMVKKCIELARENGCYQVRAYCDINNIPSNMLWIKNDFTISPVAYENGKIPGSYVTYKL